MTFVKSFTVLLLAVLGLVTAQDVTLRNQKVLENTFFNEWRSLKEINSALKLLYQEGSQHTAHISLYSIGKSAEGKNIFVLSIGKGALEIGAKMKKVKPKKSFQWKESLAVPVDSEQRTDIAVVGTLHGREWSAASSVLFSCWETIQLLAMNASLVHEKTFHFLPVMNPDGYQFTFEKAGNELNSEFTSMSASNGRLWRKNRRNLCSKKMRGSKCAHGVDLNRNFGIDGLSWGFGNSKVTTEVFQGKRPFSEPENKRIGEWLSLVGGKLKVLLDVHCCSSAVLKPYFYRNNIILDNLNYDEVCETVSTSMGEKYNCRKRETSFSESNTGIFADWVANEVKVPLVFIVETRGNSESKKMEKIFLVPKEAIVDIGKEVSSAVTFLSSFELLKQQEPVIIEEEIIEKEVILSSEVVDEREELDRLFLELERGATFTTLVADETISYENTDSIVSVLEDIQQPSPEETFEKEEEAVVVVDTQNEESWLFYCFVSLSGLTIILGVIVMGVQSRKSRKIYLNKVI